MKFLLDTNILIPLEPVAQADIADQTQPANDFVRHVQETGHQICIHPEVFKDIERDKDEQRRSMRMTRFSKYPLLPDPPPIPRKLREEIGESLPESRDWVDHHLIAALCCDAVDYLVTEDQGLIRKCIRVGYRDRVATLADAASMVSNLLDTTPTPPPAVRDLKAHNLDESDPIFASLRLDYRGFDDWFRDKCKRQNRQSWIVTASGSSSYCGLAIVKPEKSPPDTLHGKVLKVCTFKVSARYQGMRFGELLLKTVFRYAVNNHYDWLYLTVYPKYANLVDFLGEFGFKSLSGQTGLGELVFAKPLTDPYGNAEHFTALDYHVRYGPRLAQWDTPSCFVIPILPQYHKLLFPEMESQLDLMPGGYPFGNSIRKAYLCHSRIRRIWQGDNLLFYRSDDIQAITVHGVAEGTLRSASPEDMARYVGKRSVYRLAEINTLCQKRVLAILFRQARVLKTTLPLQQLQQEGVLKSAPQSIMELSSEAKQWVASQMSQ